MKYFFYSLLLLTLVFQVSCNSSKSIPQTSSEDLPFTWDNATIYFMLTDRFNNGNPNNDFSHPVKASTLRGFEGGDVKGITQKINAGYFSDLGVTALWMTPLQEQIQGATDEGTGLTYPYHGYWIRDWSAFDARFGTKDEIKEMVDAAHAKGIRVLFDVVINHTGPVTDKDSQYPDSWVRTSPKCTYASYESTVNCTLVENLPDVLTDSENEVELPDFLVEKWKSEGRYDNEIQELDKWFKTTKLKRTPSNYILKWLIDLVKDFGIDGFRIDTAKHVDEEVWKILNNQAKKAYKQWQKDHPNDPKLQDEFYTLGEVYGFNVENGVEYDFGDKKVNYYNYGFTSLINFGFKDAAKGDFQSLYTKYDQLLHNESSAQVVHYMSSHDDGSPFDPQRKNPFETATKLILAPGTIQIYYGDESGRILEMEGANGDANLRSFMNWNDLLNMNRQNGYVVNDLLIHCQKLGQFRKKHPAVGAGKLTLESSDPYITLREWKAPNGSVDKVLVGVEMPKGIMHIDVASIAKDGDQVRDAYSGVTSTVANGEIILDSVFDIVLLEKVAISE